MADEGIIGDVSDDDSEPSILAHSGTDEWEPSSSDDAGSVEGEGGKQALERKGSASHEERETPKQTRKRRKYENKKETRKRLRNSGCEYNTKKGKVILGKTFKNNDCLCRQKCFQKITQEKRKYYYESFWNLRSFTAQNAFLCGLVKQTVPQQKDPRNHSRSGKSVSNKFSIQSQGQTFLVCKTYFLQTFQISDGRMTRALRKLQNGEQLGSDNRGHAVSANKISDNRMAFVREHIQSFSSYQSHYSRTKNPNRKYLSSDLNVSTLYRLYKESREEKNVIPVSIDIYRRTFNTEYNLHFHAPHTDTCKRCDSYIIRKGSLTDKTEIKKLEVEHEVHLRRAERARTSMKSDTEKAMNDPSLYVFKFNLEKALAFPKLSTSIAYYKRNMYVYNLGCHELTTGNAFMYCWD